MQKLTILKIGGKLLDDDTQLGSALSAFANIAGAKILVHGGGKKGSEISRRLGIEPQMVEGRRITDAATLEVVTMVYAGLLNKAVVAKLQALGCNAIGLSGADGNAILAKKRGAGAIDYGFVGDVETVNNPLIISFLENNLIPVFSPITHDGNGQLLNTNADTIARMLAVSLSKNFEVKLLFCFEKNGVLLDPTDDDSVLPSLDTETYEQYRASGVISEGMVPKLDNAFAAKNGGVEEVWVCGVEGISGQKGTQILLQTEAILR
ncbi:MAG: acetylglutamate kinase [Bacteroidetes bacterium]|nr:acetylglutamate kinase [Bacteroidota bacterium]